MFKHTLIALTALASLSTPAMAQNTSFTGRVVSAGKNVAPGISTSSGVTYGCNDRDLGYFDMCIDVVVFTTKALTDITIDPKINPMLSNQKPNILVRYAVRVPASVSGQWAIRNARVTSRLTGTRTINAVGVNDREYVIFAQVTDNGGQSWRDHFGGFRRTNM